MGGSLPIVHCHSDIGQIMSGVKRSLNSMVVWSYWGKTVSVVLDPEVFTIKAMYRTYLAQRLCALFLCVAAAVSVPFKAAAEDVTLWVYHNFSPYIVDADIGTGISYDLAEMLTAKSNGRYQFRVVVLPRQRLNLQLEAGAPGVVLWANPAWFGDADRSRYDWSDPILTDRNVVISPAEAAFDYSGPNSLRDMTLVGVRGHRYAGVDPLVTAGEVERVDVRAERDLVQFIASGRGEVAIVAHSAAQYFVGELELESDVHFAPEPHSQYQRFVMIHEEPDAIDAFLNDAIARVAQSQQWADRVATYGLNVSPL